MRSIISALLAVPFVLFASQLHAQTTNSKSIVVEQPWARATPGGARTGATYLALKNNGDSPDQLVGATTSVAEKVQFHSVVEENGVSSMREMPIIDLPPGSTVTFSPGGMHIMLVGLKQPLKEHQTFQLILTFAKAGKLDVMIPVAKVGAMRPGNMGSMKYGGEGMMGK